MSEEIEWQTAVARVVDLMMALTETLVFQWKPRDFEVSFATFCALTPLSTFSSWNFLRHSGILKRQAFEQYDDPEILPMHNLLGRMSALDGNFVIFFQSSCNCGRDQPADTVCHEWPTFGIRPAMWHLTHEPPTEAVATILEKGWIAVCGIGEDPWTFDLSLYDVKGWVLMSIAWDSQAHDRNEQSCHWSSRMWVTGMYPCWIGLKCTSKMKVCLICGCTGKTRFHAYDVRDDDMVFSTFGFISSHAFWFYTGTLLFIDLGSKLLVSSRVCLVREHVYWVECLV